MRNKLLLHCMEIGMMKILYSYSRKWIHKFSIFLNRYNTIELPRIGAKVIAVASRGNSLFR